MILHHALVTTCTNMPPPRPQVLRPLSLLLQLIGLTGNDTLSSTTLPAMLLLRQTLLLAAKNEASRRMFVPRRPMHLSIHERATAITPCRRLLLPLVPQPIGYIAQDHCCRGCRMLSWISPSMRTPSIVFGQSKIDCRVRIVVESAARAGSMILAQGIDQLEHQRR